MKRNGNNKKKQQHGPIWVKPVHPHPALKGHPLPQGRGVKKKKKQQVRMIVGEGRCGQEIFEGG
jgi:hypothetical protein